MEVGCHDRETPSVSRGLEVGCRKMDDASWGVGRAVAMVRNARPGCL